MEKQNTDPEIPVDIYKLLTLKLMMEAMIKVLRNIVEKLKNDPRYTTMLEQQAVANNDLQERIDNLKISGIGSCGNTPFVRKTKSDMLGVTSPTTPGRVKKPFKIWRDDPEIPGDDTGALHFVSERGTSTEEVCGESSMGIVKESEEVCEMELGREDGDDGSAERCRTEEIGEKGEKDEDGEATESDDDETLVKRSRCV